MTRTLVMTRSKFELHLLQTNNAIVSTVLECASIHETPRKANNAENGAKGVVHGQLRQAIIVRMLDEEKTKILELL